MASHVICGCGVQYRVQGATFSSPRRCPICGRAIKFNTSSAKVPTIQPGLSRVQLGLGLGSAAVITIGAVVVAMSLRTSPASDRTPPTAPAPVQAVANFAPARVTPSAAANTELGNIDRLMLPSTPIGGLGR